MRKIGILLMVIGLCLVLSYFLYYGYLNKEETDNIELYVDATSTKKEAKQEPEVVVEEIKKEPEVVIEEVKKEKKSSEIQLEYKAILEIPKIKLKKGVVEATKNFNSINYAISIDRTSNYPNETGNFILYAHSGNSKKSYFKNLNKLNVNDEVFVYYEGVKYNYQIVDKYEIEKIGKMAINRYKDRKLITMVTCIRNTNKQVVLIGEQISNEKY